MRNRRHLTDWLEAFQDTFANTEAPEKYVYWIGVGTIAAALQRNVVFDEITFQLYPNQYIVLVGPPAVKKSTAISFGLNLLRLVEGIHIGPSSVTWQYLVDILVDIQTPTPEETAKTGILVKDSCPIILPASEFGTLIDFEDRNAINFFTECWDSPKTFDKGTRLMGDQKLNGPCPSIMAGTTPEWVKDNIKGATRKGGFISRCIMPYANRPRRIITYPSQHVSVDHSERLSKLAHDLACIAMLRGNYRMTPDAMAFGDVWHKETSESNFNKRIEESSDNWANRRYSHVHKLCMAIAASKRDDLIITKEDVVEAVQRVDGIHSDFNHVFALMDQRPQVAGARELEGYLATKQQVAISVLMQDMRQKFTKREIVEALAVLEAGKLISKSSTTVAGPGGGLAVSEMIHYHGTKK